MLLVTSIPDTRGELHASSVGVDIWQNWYATIAKDEICGGGRGAVGCLHNILA